MIIVSDATPLIGLAKIEQLALLQDMFGEVLIPPAVFKEVVTNAPKTPDAAMISRSAWIRVRKIADISRVDYLRVDLDPGEAESLVLAYELNADWILLDETKARLAAELLKIHFIGTVGLSLLAKRRGKINKVGPLLNTLRAHKFYISDRLCQNVLQQAGEL